MITNQFKQRVVNAMKSRGEQYPSSAKAAKAFGINASQYSRLKRGELSRVISDAKFITLARKLDVNLKEGYVWRTAKTPAFMAITQQLEDCQRNSISAILVDAPDVGKSHTAKEYVKRNKNAVYVDCSQVKTKQLFVRKIAQEFGVDHTAKYQEVYEDLTYYLRTMDTPLVIIDEAGDLATNAFLELKALWNATERACGWYLMGADGLKAKMEKRRALKKVGYAELFRRYGSRFQRISPAGGEELEEFKKKQFALVAAANGMQGTQKLYHKSNGSLERVRIEYEKMQNDGQMELVNN